MLLCATLVNGDDSICPTDWTYEDDAERCYRVVKEKITWEGAQRWCRNWGATLANIPDEKTDEALRTFLSGRINSPGFHIGLRYTYKPPSPKGDWRWPDSSMPDYTNWQDGRALLALGKCAEAFLVEQSGGRWSPTDCTSTKRYAVCELPPWSSLKSGDGAVEKAAPAVSKPDEPKPDIPANVGACTDHGPDCATAQILCNHKPYYRLMTLHCPKTCNRCKGAKPIAQNVLQKDTFAKIRYVELMKKRCPVTCLACTAA